MKKFIFKLEPLLNFRKQEEHLKRKELFLAHTHLQHLIGKMEELEKECLDLDETIRRKSAIHVDTAEIVGFYDYKQVVNEQLKRYKEEIAKTHQRIEKRREAVIEAMQKRKIVENLQEKQSSSWESAFQEKEKTFFDELATIRYMRDKQK